MKTQRPSLELVWWHRFKFIDWIVITEKELFRYGINTVTTAVFLWGDPDPDQWSKICLDHGTWKEQVNPWPEWICPFLWCTMIKTNLGSLIQIWITPKERSLHLHVLWYARLQNHTFINRKLTKNFICKVNNWFNTFCSMKQLEVFLLDGLSPVLNLQVPTHTPVCREASAVRVKWDKHTNHEATAPPMTLQTKSTLIALNQDWNHSSLPFLALLVVHLLFCLFCTFKFSFSLIFFLACFFPAI